MKRLSTLIATMLITALSLVLSFLHFQERDTYGPLGFTTQVWVQDAAPEADANAALSEIPGFASDTGVAVARWAPMAEDPEFGRTLYIYPGAVNRPMARWLEGGYPAFSHLAETQVRPWAALPAGGLDPRGYYLLDGSLEQGQRLAALFAQHGFQAGAYPAGGLGLYVMEILRGELGRSGAIGLLVSIVLVSASVLLNAKHYGTGRLFGRSGWWMLAADLRAALPASLAVVTISVSGTVIGLWFYNRLSHWDSFLTLSATLATGMFLATLATHGLAIWATNLAPIPAALKGRVPSRTTLAAAYTLRVAALTLTVASGISTIMLINPASKAARGAEVASRRAGDAGYVMINGSLGARDTTSRIHGALRDWLAQADLDGRLVLAEDSTNVIASRKEAAAALTVNPSFLRHQPLQGLEGQVTPDSLPTDRPTLLVPATSMQAAEALRQNADTFLSEVARDGGGVAPTSAAVREILPGQEVFTYGHSTGPDPAVLDAPVVLVVPPHLGVWGNRYPSMASDMVLIPGTYPEDIRADPVLASAFLATLPVTQKLADTARTARVSLTIATLNTAVGSVLLAVVVASAVAVYVRAWANRLYVRSLHGWSRLAANPVLLVLECAIALGTASWAISSWLAMHSERAAFQGIPMPTRVAEIRPEVPGLVASIAILLSAIVAATVLARRERRLLADRAVDAL